MDYVQSLRITNISNLLKTLNLHLCDGNANKSHIIYLYGGGTNGKSKFIEAINDAYPNKLLKLPFSFIDRYNELMGRDKVAIDNYYNNDQYRLYVYPETPLDDNKNIDSHMRSIINLVKNFENIGLNIPGSLRSPIKINKCFIIVSNIPLTDLSIKSEIIYCEFGNIFESNGKFEINDLIINSVKAAIDNLCI